MNILIVGVNGFLGKAIAASALRKAHNVFGLSRTPRGMSQARFTYVSGDRTDCAAIVDLIQEQQIDVLVDVIPMTLADTQPLLIAAANHLHQYVMISSSDVYRNYELLQRRATGRPTSEPIAEDSALRQTRYPYREQVARAPDAADAYLDDYDKILIENAAKEISSNWTILRLPMVYGPGDKQRRFRWVIKPMSAREGQLFIPNTWAHWHSTYGYIDNVAEAIALTIGNSKAYNRVFNVGEKSSRSHLDWAQRIAEAMNWDGSIELTDDADDPFTRRIASLDLNVPFKVSSSRIRDELGFTEIVAQTHALERTIASELQPATGQG